MRRRDFIASTAAAALPARAQAPRPNIVFILADDLGYGDLGCYGQKRVRTPHIDRLAAEGTRFTDAYAGSTVCAPSRCCLMTGKHTGHARVRRNGGELLRAGDLTFTELLKRAGYRTAIYGKWSLGGIGMPGYPTLKGFDDWFGYFNQGHAHHYYPDVLLENNREYMVRGNFGMRQDYAQDLFTARALRFLEKQGSDPFFLHLTYTIPHANNELGKATGNGMEVPNDEPYSREDWPQTEKNFAAMMTRLDADVGKVMAALQKRKLDGNTLIIFASDNGPHREGGHDPEFFASGGGLRGIKRSLYEGGIRVPMLARWPGKTPAGATSAFPWAFWDFFPTACELAGVPKPAGLDGTSILPTLLGREQKPPAHLYWEFHEGGFRQAVRMGEWKAVRPQGRPSELYNLKEDRAEARNVAAAHPEIVREAEHVMAASHTEEEA